MDTITSVFAPCFLRLLTHFLQHLPFQFPGTRKLTFGLKLATFLSVGFSIPFLASYHQMLVPYRFAVEVLC